MEIYYFYDSAVTLGSLIESEPLRILYGGLIAAVAVWAILFVLQGFGLYAMAKKRGMKHKWLSFVPFANIHYIGKLTGACDVFGQKMKRAGLYTMLAQIFTTLICASIIASQLYLYTACGTPKYDDWNLPYWTDLQGFSLTVFKFYDVSVYILSIAQLVYEVLMLILIMGLYKKYAPRNYILLSFLTLFVPMARFITVFALRNRTAIDYDAYIRARREAYMRSQQQYRGYYGGYNAPNGNPYGNPYANPYAPPQNQKPAPPPEEPFAEFASEKKPSAPTSGETEKIDGDSDGFFD